MAEVVPFRGVLYNPEIVTDMADVVAPPYDVITTDEQESFHKRHPNNVIRLILGKAQSGEVGKSGIHARAGKYFQQWMEEKILVRDEEPAFYLTSVEFSAGKEMVTRYGLIGLVRLEPFDKGIVLPHERTFSKVKSERLQLMKACHSNFSPIFGLYSDDTGMLNRLQSAIQDQKPDMALTDSKGLRHKLWRIRDQETLANVSADMESRTIYIADGHHRYETALDYRDWVKDNNADFSHTHPANYVMMSLSSLEDPGMVIFPAHRLLSDVPQEKMAALLSKANEYFEIKSFPIGDRIDDSLSEADAYMASHSDKNAIGVFIRNQMLFHVLVLKEGVMERMFAEEMPTSLLDLDVSVLTRLLMMELLGFDQARLDDATKINYCTTSQAAVKKIMDGEADIAFILNPTKIEQVKRVSENGLIMPRKSTYFYPKVASGKVMNLLI